MNSNKDSGNKFDNIPKNEGQEFYGEEIRGEQILQDGTDYTDIVEETKNKKRIIIISIIATIILATAGLAYLGKIFILDNPEDREPQEPTVTQQEETAIEEFTPDYKAPSNPVTELLPETEVDNKEIKAFVNDNQIQTSDGTNITIDNATITETVNECKVSNPADFCNIAEISINDKENYYGYFLKDALNSKFFETPENFTTIEIENTPAAATMTISTLDGNKTPILLLIQSNGSGIMFISEQNTAESLTELQNNINFS